MFGAARIRSAGVKTDVWDVPINLREEPTWSGKHVDPDTAFKYSVFWAAVTLISDAISGLRPEAFVELEDGRLEPRRVPLWVRRPHPELPRSQVWSQLLMSALAWGNGYAQLVYGDHGAPIGFMALRPDMVECEWDPDRPGFRRYRIAGEDGRWLTSREILHLQGPTMPGAAKGLSVIASARQAIALGLTLEEFGARYFSQGSMAKVVIKIPGKTLTREDAKKVVQTYEQFHRGPNNWHRPAVLTGPAGADIQQISIPPNDAQFLESRKFQALDVARWFHVPPHRVGIMDVNTSWGSGLAEENTALVQTAYRPWILRLEETLTAYTSGGAAGGVQIHLDDSDLQRGTFREAANTWGSLVEQGIVTPNEARKRLGLPPVEGGDQLMQAKQAEPDVPENVDSAPADDEE